MKLTRRVLVPAAIAVAAFVILAAVAAMGWARYLKGRGVPDYGKDVALEGLHDRVTVYRDRYAVPHIYARDEHDCYLATGYCMAQDRMWQMDLVRRVAAGRLSEILGKDMVEVDLLFRALRIERKSREILERSDPAVTASLRAFADGVNQYLKHAGNDLPLEFSVLGYRPEPWEPLHSISLIGYMGWDLTMPWTAEILYREIRKKVGEEKFREIVPDIGATASAIYASSPTGEAGRFALLEGGRALESLGLGVFSASNNWAVSGARSATGKPLFSNDMHLGYFSPGIWYQIHQCVGPEGGGEDSLNVTGVAVPGQPFIISGHNTRIAWGMTNVMIDDMDFFEEKVDAKNPDRYFYRGEWRNMEVVTEKIKVKGGGTEEKKLRYTVHGPVVSELKGLKDEVITMHWGGNYYTNEVETMYRLNRAGNFGDFREALRTFRALSQNIAYADTWGNIGIVCAAGIPIRKKGNGLDVVPGWTDEYEWAGFVPYEQQPFLYNPPNGIVLSANNRTSATFPHHVSHWFYPPYRYDRIKEMLLAREKHTVGDFLAMHGDMTSHLARKMRERIIRIMDPIRAMSRSEKESLELLRAWDCGVKRDSAAAALFERFYVEFVTRTFRNAMGGSSSTNSRDRTGTSSTPSSRCLKIPNRHGTTTPPRRKGVNRCPTWWSRAFARR